MTNHAFGQVIPFLSEHLHAFLQIWSELLGDSEEPTWRQMWMLKNENLEHFFLKFMYFLCCSLMKYELGIAVNIICYMKNHTISFLALSICAKQFPSSVWEFFIVALKCPWPSGKWMIFLPMAKAIFMFFLLEQH